MAYVLWIVGFLLLLTDRAKKRAPSARSPYKAAAASLFLRGLGQLYNGQPRKALVFWATGAAPVLLATLAGLFAHFWGMVIVIFMTIASGVWALLDALRTAETLQDYTPRKLNRWYIYVGVIIVAELISRPVISAVGVRAFRIPSEAMLPALEAGDFIIAKLETPESYPNKRGDVLVFKYPGDGTTDYIKRVVAFPGETMEIRGGSLLINGSPVLDPWAPTSRKSDHETAPDFGPLTVPDGTLFMLGDNWVESADSRVWGPLPRENIVGVAKFIYFSWDPVTKDVRLSRIGLGVQGGE